MKILHVTRSLILDSGVSVFVGEIANALAGAGYDVDVACEWYPDYSTGKATCAVRTDFSDGIDADIVHVQGLWDLYSLKAMRQCFRQGIPYVVSPHGGLMPRVFSKGRIKKFVFWHVLLKPLLKRAAVIHCTSEAEKSACQKLGLKGPFIIAPLGVHLPEIEVENIGGGGQRTVLFLGRLSEEKGLLNLLDAWHQLQQEVIAPKLILAGPDWRGYKKLLESKIAADHIAGVEFAGSADAVLKDKLYRAADIFVLPSPMENFSMVVLDALAYGVPAIATKGTPWSELEGNGHSGAGKCGWWIDQGVTPLANALREALSYPPSHLALLGRNGRALAERRYQWPIIAQNLIDCYQEVCHANAG